MNTDCDKRFKETQKNMCTLCVLEWGPGREFSWLVALLPTDFSPVIYQKNCAKNFQLLLQICLNCSPLISIKFCFMYFEIIILTVVEDSYTLLIVDDFINHY